MKNHKNRPRIMKNQPGWLQETPRRKWWFFVTDRQNCIIIYTSSSWSFSSPCNLRYTRVSKTFTFNWCSPTHVHTCFQDAWHILPLSTTTELDFNYCPTTSFVSLYVNSLGTCFTYSSAEIVLNNLFHSARTFNLYQWFDITGLVNIDNKWM